MRCLYIFEINPVSFFICKYFLQFQELYFVLFMVSFAVASLVAQMVKTLSAMQETQV